MNAAHHLDPLLIADWISELKPGKILLDRLSEIVSRTTGAILVYASGRN